MKKLISKINFVNSLNFLSSINNSSKKKSKGILKYLFLSLLSLILIINLLFISPLKLIPKSHAEKAGSSPANNSTSRIKQLYDKFSNLGHGTGINFWNRIDSAGSWQPTATATPEDVTIDKTFYAGNRTIKTGTAEPASVATVNNWTGGDVYLKGENLNTATSVTGCQSHKILNNNTIRCTINPSINNSKQTISAYNLNAQLLASVIVKYDGTNQGNMQDFRSPQCNNLKRGQVIILTDQRNNQTYRVKKMADDKCWMIDNLRYADKSWTQSNTNNYLTKNGGYYPANDNNWNSYQYKDPGNSTDGCPPGSLANCYGYLYNWYTATYGTGKYTQSSGDVAGNICPNTIQSGSEIIVPNGWKLPTGGGSFNSNNMTNSDYAVLNTAMKDDNGINAFTTGQAGSSHSAYLNDPIYNSAWQPTGTFQGSLSGYNFSSLRLQGKNGYYWSSTANSSYQANSFSFSSNFVYPGSSKIDKYAGFAVRCLVTP